MSHPATSPPDQSASERGVGPTLAIGLLVLLAGSYVVNAMDRQVFPVLLPAVRNEYGFSLGQGGLLATIFTLGIGLAGLPSGYLLDRFSRKAVMVAGILIYSAFTLLTTASTGFGDMFGYRAASGVGEAMQNAALFSAIGAFFFRRRALALGSLNFAYGLGSFLGPLLGSQLQEGADSWRLPLLIYGGLGIVFAVVILVGVPKRFTERREPAAPEERGQGAGLATSLWNRNSMLLALIAAITGLAMYGYIGLYPTFLEDELGFTGGQAGFTASMFGLGALMGIPAGLLGDRYDPRYVIGGAFVGAMVVGFLVFNGPTGRAAQAILSFGVGTFASGFLFVNVYSALQRSIRPDYVGRASGLFVASLYIPSAFAGYLFSALVDAFDWGGAGLVQLTLLPIVGIIAVLCLDGSRFPRSPRTQGRRMSTSPTTPPGPRRFHEQRWLLDQAIRTDGLEWDQPRVAYTVRPMGVDGLPDFHLARTRITKYGDLVPVFTGLAARRERLAREAEAVGRTVTAREHWFHAALLFVTAEWSIFETTPELVALDDRKNACYANYARLADHHVERVEVPFGDAFIPAWLHLPVGHQPGTRLPTVLSCGGMDAPKELNVSLYGDKFLERGFAVLAFDGPGQGEAPVRGVTFTPDAWIDAGEALMAWLAGRPEVDQDAIVGFGLSFGSYWMTQVAATQPRLKGSAVGLVCHEHGGHAIFEQASPTFKARYMWMSGLEHDEDAFDAMAARLDLGPLVERMPSPWLVIAGDLDELSPIEHSYDLAARCAAPAPMLVYEGGRHALSLPTPSVALGPQWIAYAADWLLDRIAGHPAEDVVDHVGPDGLVQRRPHPKEHA